MLEEAKSKVKECVEAFKSDSVKCVDEQTYLMLYDKLGSELSELIQRYKSFELACYVRVMIDTLFEPVEVVD